MLSVWDSRLNFPGLDPECLEHLARLLHTNNWDSKSSLLGTLWKYGNVWSLLLSMRYASQIMEGNQDILFLLNKNDVISIIKYSRHLDDGNIKVFISLKFRNEGYYSVYRHLKNGLDSDSRDGGRGHSRWKKRQGVDSRHEGEQIIWWEHKKSCLTEIWDTWRKWFDNI